LAIACCPKNFDEVVNFKPMAEPYVRCRRGPVSRSGQDRSVGGRLVRLGDQFLGDQEQERGDFTIR